MKTFKFIFGFLFLLLFLQMDAQDARYSQYYAAPLHNNPALTGIFPGQFRVMANYRNQWAAVLGSAAYNTYGASFDYRINTFQNDYAAVGVHFLRDDAGDSRFNQTKAYLSLAYLKQLSGSRYQTSAHYVSLGFQGGLAQHGMDWSQLSFSNQFDNTLEEYNPSNPTGENFGVSSKSYIDLNAGLVWYGVYDENLSTYAGFSILHINQPDVSFYDGSVENLFTRFIGQAGAEIPFNDFLSIMPSVIFTKQGPSYETQPGFNFRYNNHDLNELALRAGAFIRVVNDKNSAMITESVIISSMLEIERFLIGLSYDLNVSGMRRATNSRGAFELSFQYIHPENKRYQVACPKF